MRGSGVAPLDYVGSPELNASWQRMIALATQHCPLMMQNCLPTPILSPDDETLGEEGVRP